MLVKQLIQQLKKLDPNLSVGVTWDGGLTQLDKNSISVQMIDEFATHKEQTGFPVVVIDADSHGNFGDY